MNTHSTSQGIARVVTEMLAEAGVSQLRTSESTGIPRATLIRRLSGVTSFQVAELEAIASLLGTSVSAIVARAEQDAA